VGSDLNANRKWPNFLAQRLVQSGKSDGVLNEGIGANKLLSDQTDQIQPSASGLSRFNRDVLGRPGVKTVIVADGINDIGASDDQGDPAQWVLQLENAYEQLAAISHRHGVKMVVGTLTPIGGSGYDSQTHQTERQLFNDWLRASPLFDGVADFDLAARDPAHPDSFNPAYDCGDHLHPNSSGYSAMASVINLGGL
jgi:lysophospholipase L1-like esterase